MATARKSETRKTALPTRPGKGGAHGANTAKAEVDAQLERYRAMRDFGVTAEPSGGAKNKKGLSADSAADSATVPVASGNPFVIQKHAATRLHYDFRLGWRGVLKSWAVTKGPSYVTADKRLAVEVEDHPMEYGGFEGTIPKGQYGGGTVMLWDHGTWEPQAGYDVDEMLRKGSLKFILHGEKLQGKWALIRMGGKAASESKPNWLLIKEHDEFERKASDAAVTEAEPDSVLTGRDLEAIGQQQDHVWQSNRPEEPVVKNLSAGARLRERLQSKASAPTKTAGASDDAAASKAVAAKARSGARSGRVKKTSNAKTDPEKSDPEKPGPNNSDPAPAALFVTPELAFQANEPPRGDAWVHELKYDGYRMQAICENGDARLLTRSGLDWTHRMPSIAAALNALELNHTVVDGEVLVLNAQGQSDFAALQAAFQNKAKSQLLYYCFDLLRDGGEDYKQHPLLKRKEKLKQLLGAGGKERVVRYSEHVAGEGDALFDEACRLGAEGIVSKRAASKYCSGRQPDWIKVKCYKRQELVIGGYTLPTHAGRGIGALLLGYYRDGELIYAGRTGTGFTAKSGPDLRRRLDEIQVDKNPFVAVDTASRRGAVWVKPRMVCEVSFANWTSDGSVRQASFQGLREDKKAAEVRREEALPVESVTAKRLKSDRKKDTENATGNATTKKDAEAAKKSSVKNAKPGATLAGAKLRLTHPDKVLDATTGVTKQQLAEYLAAVSDVMLPHVVDRPLSLLRCPAGVAQHCFYQKHTSLGMPAGIGAAPIPDVKKGGAAEDYVTVQDADGLVGTAQMGAIELHPWGSRNQSLEKPDRLIFDLDPDTSLDWTVVVQAALHVRRLLESYELKTFVKLSGGKGLHVVAPITPEHEWPAIKVFCRRIAEELEAAAPTLYLIKMTKAARVNKIFIDYLRNERGSTAIAPWCVRARPGMGAALPLSWDELSESETMPQFKLAEFASWRFRVAADPWKAMPQMKQRLRLKAKSA